MQIFLLDDDCKVPLHALAFLFHRSRDRPFGCGRNLWVPDGHRAADPFNV